MQEELVQMTRATEKVDHIDAVRERLAAEEAQSTELAQSNKCSVKTVDTSWEAQGYEEQQTGVAPSTEVDLESAEVLSERHQPRRASVAVDRYVSLGKYGWNGSELWTYLLQNVNVCLSLCVVWVHLNRSLHLTKREL